MKIKSNIDKIAIIAMLLIAMVSPLSFPQFSFISSKFGLNSSNLLGNSTMLFFQIAVSIILIGTYISYRQSLCIYPLFIASASSILIFINCNQQHTYSLFLIYIGMLGLVIAAGLNHYRKKTKCTCEPCKILNSKTENN